MTIAVTQNSNIKSQSHSLNIKTDLKKRTYNFSVDMVRFINSISASLSNTIISKQLIRSSTSIGANLVEARSSSSRKDFTNFYTHALKSANETKYWLSLLKDTGSFDVSKIDLLLSEVNEISNILAASILTLKEKNKF